MFDLRQTLEGLVEAVTPHVNEHGAGGYLLARLSDARNALRQGEWRPIDTAPRHADTLIPVLICAEGTVGEAEWYGEPDSDSSDDGWWWANSHGEHWAERIIPEPTHWMPLPEPPSSENPK